MKRVFLLSLILGVFFALLMGCDVPIYKLKKYFGVVEQNKEAPSDSADQVGLSLDNQGSQTGTGANQGNSGQAGTGLNPGNPGQNTTGLNQGGQAGTGLNQGNSGQTGTGLNSGNSAQNASGFTPANKKGMGLTADDKAAAQNANDNFHVDLSLNNPVAVASCPERACTDSDFVGIWIDYQESTANNIMYLNVRADHTITVFTAGKGFTSTEAATAIDHHLAGNYSGDAANTSVDTTHNNRWKLSATVPNTVELSCVVDKTNPVPGLQNDCTHAQAGQVFKITAHGVLKAWDVARDVVATVSSNFGGSVYYQVK